MNAQGMNAIGISSTSAASASNSSATSALQAVADQLRSQIAKFERQGGSQRQLAEAVVALMDEGLSANPPVLALASRMAWLIAVYAPCYDPVLVTTLPFCLESILDGYASFDDLIDHVLASQPDASVAPLPDDFLIRPARDLAEQAHRGALTLRDDPAVYERIIDRLMVGDVGEIVSNRKRPAGEKYMNSASNDAFHGGERTVLTRWPTALREAAVSVLQVEPSPRAVPLMCQITERLDARSVRRLAVELVHISADGDNLRIRGRAAASLLAMSKHHRF
ncbi:MAG TPA: hypothetical protein PLJ27_10140 [Polyangiaceae bacterium]|jgi:hypothetical protein|nr:MAG: hypothetical protein BWY17_03152 [Deltaproteobacteria bacterium ADurb.Bin207]HNS97666.1 hypothetical protein [Polyangiaceae bacterium]HNZ24818.1 hypothetical protein [Polyangiaceae bacterium]HOD22034.1 hypothetical protein [Polyangiaceae bacterium]HOE48001.1 hypothetical protein [Polyangiaceae bacterium]